MMNAHIGLNAHLLSLSQSYRGAGISWYMINLLRRLAETAPDFRYSLFLNERAFVTPGLTRHYSWLPTHKPLARILWEQLCQPFALRRAGVDLLHALAFVGPVVAPCPFIVTVYDLSFLRYPEAFRPLNRLYLTHFTASSVKRASAIIAISESTRQDLITLLGAPPERTHTIYCGVDAAFRPLPAAEVAAFKQARQLPNTFVLFLGTLEPRKNLGGLLRAYGQWRQADPFAPPLLIAGGQGWYYAQIYELVKTLHLAEHVHFTGYVPQADLPLFYNAAALFVYPSHFEGFGLPVLEAMACGTPVITSNLSSLPEVAGEAALLVDPTDTVALAEAMAEVMDSPARRADLGQQALARAAQFSWQQTTLQTVALYRQVISS
jgi:glycosyltransferase involved in cell wall biosynthesis